MTNILPTTNTGMSIRVYEIDDGNVNLKPGEYMNTESEQLL